MLTKIDIFKTRLMVICKNKMPIRPGNLFSSVNEYVANLLVSTLQDINSFDYNDVSKENKTKLEKIILQSAELTEGLGIIAEVVYNSYYAKECNEFQYYKVTQCMIKKGLENLCDRIKKSHPTQSCLRQVVDQVVDQDIPESMCFVSVSSEKDEGSK